MAPARKQAIPVYEEVKWERVTENKISTVMALLPASLQSRMGPFRSIRRSMSLYNLRSKGWTDHSSPRPRPLSEADAMALTDGELVPEVIEADDTSRAEADPLLVAAAPGREIYSEQSEGELSTRTASGIHWRFARQGASLLSIAFGGSKSATDEVDRAFERKVYIDGLAYLLNGLPQDLDAAEAEQLRSALPARVGARYPRSAGPGAASLDAGAEAPRSILHRAVQWAVVHAIFVFHLVMPYLVQLFKLSARMERKYKISERLVGGGIDVAASIGKQGVSLTDSICKMNDGMVGKALSEAVAWTVDGVTRGISDGVGEGVMRARVRGAA